MLFPTIVIAMAAMLLILIGVWLFNPALRRWMEEPKYRMLRQEDRFDARRDGFRPPAREPAPPEPGSDSRPSRNVQDG